MKKLLILGAGYFEKLFIQKAQSLGYYVIAIDGHPDAIGFKEASQSVMMNLANRAACLAIAQINRVDGVIAPVSPVGALTANYIAQQLDLPGLNPEVAKLLADKLALRQCVTKHKLSSSQRFYSVKDLNELPLLQLELNFPVMVKPADVSYSKTSKKVEHAAALYAICRKAMETSPSGHIMIEEYIKGREYSAEAFVYHGEVYILGIMAKTMMPSANFFEVGLSLPSRLNNEMMIRQMIIKTIKEVGVDFGSVTLDFIITPEQSFYIVSLHPHSGRNLIATHIIPKATHYDYMANLIHATVGEQITLPPSRFIRNVVTRVLFLEPFVLQRILDLHSFERKHRVRVLISEDINGLEDTLPLGDYPLVFCSLISTDDSLMRANENISRAIEEIQKVYALQ